MRRFRLSSRHRGAVMLLVGIAIGLCAVVFVIRERVFLLDEASDKMNAQSAATNAQKNFTKGASATTNRRFAATKRQFAPRTYRFRKFMPDTVSRETLLAFGLSEKQAANILNYRAKSGGFADEAQFRRLYCMNDELFSAIRPYLVFASKPPNADSPKPKPEKPKQYTPPPPVVLDLNLSDTLDLQEIKGIGSARAGRIYRYGKKLGGYVSVEQLREVWGIDEELFRELKPHFVVRNPQPKKVNVNSDDVKYLAAHPYIDFALAKAIIRFRKQYNRDFDSPEQLRAIHLLGDKEYERLLPYIGFGD